LLIERAERAPPGAPEPAMRPDRPVLSSPVGPSTHRRPEPPAGPAVLILLALAASTAGAEAPPSAADTSVDAAAGAAPPASIEERVRALEDQLRQLRATAPGAPPPTPASPPAPAAEPFAFGDFTWMNGTSRQHSRALDTRYFTPQLDLDVNYTYSFAHPNDDTVVGSTALARNNEFEISYVGLGGDLHYDHIRARLMLQYGTRATVVPRNDLSVLRGQFDLATAYRYITEGYAGYHFDALRGINLDVGIFMSYVGLFSYNNFENWAYQPSFTSDNTPWFFNGARLQIFPTDRLKVEIWLINGWQTYAKFNNLPGVGFQIRYAPREWLSLVLNGYVGTDTQDHAGRVRVHSDNSLLVRYMNRPGSRLSRGALSFTFDVGFEQGDGVVGFGGSGKEGGCSTAAPCEQNFISGMAYHRLWFFHDRIGWTVGGGFIHNPGRYLVLLPTGAAGAAFDTAPGSQFDGWDVSTTLDYMPEEHQTWRLEVVHREASVPYFAGPGGVTSPDGYQNTPIPFGWAPDQRRSETRLILAVLVRI
jgi:hypothetical protein